MSNKQFILSKRNFYKIDKKVKKTKEIKSNLPIGS